MSAAALLDQLAERRMEQAEADLRLLREAFELGQINRRELTDAATQVAMMVIPDLRVIESDAPAPTTKKCACGAEIPSRYRKCDDCLGGK